MNSIICLPKNKLAWIVTGVFQSDTGFGFSIRKNNSKAGFRLIPYFRIELTKDSYPLIQAIQNYFCCGHISENIERNMVCFEITNFYSLWHILIPHFLNYTFYGYKNTVFRNFLIALTLYYGLRSKPPYYNKRIIPDLILAKLLYYEN